MNVCRLCLYKGTEGQFLSIWDDHLNDLPIKIYDYISIRVTKEDSLPTSACLSCIHQIAQWDHFRSICQRSNEILKSNINNLDKLNTINLNNRSIQDDHNDTKEITQNLSFKEDIGEDTSYNDELQRKKRFSQTSDHEELSYNDINTSLFIENSFLEYDLLPYQCEICLEEFKSCFEYLDHQEVHDGQLVFQCNKCIEVFSYRKDLVEHDINHKIPCQECGKMVLKTSLKSHLVMHTDKYKCTECNGRFNSNAALAQHIITVHTNIKDHICETCGKRFSSQTAIKVHMRSHSNERLYPCKLCSYAGRTASAVYVHMSTHANDSYVCEICSKIFKSNRNLNDHLRRVHSKIKRHHCTYCDKKFVDKYMLKVHIRSHTGVRPYKCNICEKAFIRSDGLKEHMRIHGQGAFYQCKMCERRFVSRKSITKHTCISLHS